MTLTDCQIFMTVSQLGTFAAAAEQMHLTPSAISHAVSGMESECGFLLFTRTKSGVTMTAAAESLLPSIRQMLNSSELLSQSIAQVNGMHKGVLRLGGVQLGLRHLGATIGAAVSKAVSRDRRAAVPGVLRRHRGLAQGRHSGTWIPLQFQRA